MTDIHKLWHYREYLTVSGATLPCELVCRLQSTLAALQAEHHFSQVQYWGRVLATDADYHVAMGLGRDALADRKYFYTTDLAFWALLPKPKKKYMHLSLLANFPFRGDPALKIKVLDESLDESVPERCQHMKEESRLAATVANICDEAHVCARGQLIKRPDGTVHVNPNFYGLTAPEAKYLKSYLHVRHPQQRWNTNLLSRPDYNYSMDFLDSIDRDVPAGCWRLALDRARGTASLQSLYWPGATYFHNVKTPDAGFLYVGNGRKCLDVPFLL